MARFGVRTVVPVVLGAVLGAVPGAGQQVLDLPGQDKAIPAALEEVFRVGSLDGADWETFGEISGVAFDGQGRLYVFDRQSSRVVVTDAQGRLVREVGKPGEGPGELRTPVSFTVLRDGTVVIADLGHRAYQLFGPDGEFRRMVSMGQDGSVIRAGEMWADPRGEAVITGGGRTRVMMSSGGPGSTPEAPKNRPIERIALKGDQVDSHTIAGGWLPPQGERPQDLRAGGGAAFRVSMAGPRTFEPGLYMGPLPDGGVAFSDTTAYAVKVVGANGTLERVLRRPFRPRPVTPAMEKAEKERQLAELEAGGGPRMRIVTSGSGGQTGAVPQDAIREMLRSRIDQMEFFPEIPVLMNLATGWGGKIWAVRRGDQPHEAGAIDVLTPAGQYVGTFAAGAMTLPSAFGPEGMVAFVERDEFDVPTVVVKRLPAILR